MLVGTVCFTVICVTIVALAVCLRRNGGMRGWVRAGRFIDLGVEIDPNSPLVRVRSIDRFHGFEPGESSESKRKTDG